MCRNALFSRILIDFPGTCRDLCSPSNEPRRTGFRGSPTPQWKSTVPLLISLGFLITCVTECRAAEERRAELWEFTADFCSACREMQPIVQDLQRQGYPIRVVNVQHDPMLARQMQVENIPCFVLVVDGQAVHRLEGSTTAERLKALLQLNGHGAGGLAPHVPNPNDLSPKVLTPESKTRSAISPDVIRRAIEATVRLKIVDPQGRSLGTGTIVDVHDDEALVITCGHIFRDSAGKGEIYCDFFGPGARQDIPGRLIGYDVRRDVGLVSVRPGVPVRPVRVGGSGYVAREHDPVFAIGCAHGAAPTVIENRILSVNRYHGPANLVVGGRPVDGRSGGGLFDRDGTLIGVCNAADQSADEGLYAALGPIHAELDAAGLGFVYRRDVATIAALDPPAARGFPNVVPTQTPQSPTDREDWTSTSVSSQPSPITGSEPTGSSPQFHSAEVIYIVRDPDHPDRTGRVFVLDRPSEALQQIIAAELSRRGPHAVTQERQPTWPIVPRQ